MAQQVLGTTKQAASVVHQKPQTLLKHYCEKGSYYGVKPVKMPSRLLLWDMAAIEALVTGAKR